MKRRLKITSTVLSLALATAITPICSANAAETTTDKIILGDVNYDGKVSILDTTEIQRYIADKNDFTDNQKFVADANADGRISILDATEVQRYVAECEGTNKNIGKTWHDAEYKTIYHPAETTTEPRLRYDLVNCNACNTCNAPLIHKDGTLFTEAEISTHVDTHTDSIYKSWRTEDVWFYVDNNGTYHDLNDDWKVPNGNCSNPNNPFYETDWWDEGAVNVFDPDFNPYLGTLALDIYNEDHDTPLDYYWTTEVSSYCHYCNYDGTSVFDEWGGCGNYKTDENGNFLRLILTEPVEIITYPDTVADMDAFTKAKNEAKQAVADHKAWHIEQNNLPDYLNGNVDAGINTHKRIYTASETVIKDAWTEKVLVNPEGWY
ncbi:MAG: dockerin type I repeat-containing protein [Ruminococcus sp.]